MPERRKAALIVGGRSTPAVLEALRWRGARKHPSRWRHMGIAFVEAPASTAIQTDHGNGREALPLPR